MKKLSLLIFPMLVAFLLFGLSPRIFAVVDNTPATTDESFQQSLDQVHQSRQEFKEARAREANEAAQIGKAKSQALRDAARQRQDEARMKMEEKRKETLLRLIELQIKHLTRTKERVQRMPNITEELKTQIANDLDAAIQKLVDMKPRVQSAAGREAIRTLAKEIRDLFKAHREIVKKIVDAIHASRLNNALAKAEERLAAIKAKIQELKNEGKETTEVEEELEDTQSSVDDAREAVGRKAFREANDDLKGAYQKFRGIAKKAKGL